VEYDIVAIDYWNREAFLEAFDQQYYFKFQKEASLEEALVYLFNEGKLKPCSQFYY
jgi:hypothetical protein